MSLSEIKNRLAVEMIIEGLCIEHKLTGEIIEFYSVQKKKDLCKIRYLKSATNKNGFQSKISGWKFSFNFNLWQKIDKPNNE